MAGRSGRLEKGLKRYKAMALDIFARMWLGGLAAGMLLFLWCSGHVSERVRSNWVNVLIWVQTMKLH